SLHLVIRAYRELAVTTRQRCVGFKSTAEAEKWSREYSFFQAGNYYGLLAALTARLSVSSARSRRNLASRHQRELRVALESRRQLRCIAVHVCDTCGSRAALCRWKAMKRRI